MPSDWRSKCFKFWCLHSLSITLGLCFIATTVVSYVVEYGTWQADFWLGLSAGSGMVFIQTLVSKWTWEYRGDPNKPPKSVKDNPEIVETEEDE
ncbi:putative membrane protein [Stenotrophomonas phage Summit]|nr:putative membrane protein [Stenotrophomonas phage Summit]